MEIDVYDSNFVFTVKPLKNGGAYQQTDQVSTVQIPAVLMWESVKTTVNSVFG